MRFKWLFLHLQAGQTWSSPVWVLCVLAAVLLPQRLRQEVDDENCHGEETSHGGKSDPHHQRLGDKLLAVLPPIPPVLSNPTPASKVAGVNLARSPAPGA